MLSLMKFVVLLTVSCVTSFATPYQELPFKPGYIAVYIREGNMPLSQVNPKLVEAFHEDESNIQGRITGDLKNEITEENVSFNDNQMPRNKREMRNENQEMEIPVYVKPNFKNYNRNILPYDL